MAAITETRLKKKVLIIINPKSGSYREVNFQKKLDEIIARHKPAYDIQPELYCFSGQEDMASRIDKALEEGFRYFAAAGGDGTVSLLADMIKGKGFIGIIPTGTGNIIARMLGIPISIEGALDVLITSERTRTMDGLEINGRLFLMSASMGFTSALLHEVDSRRKSAFGLAAYFLAGVRRIFKSDVETRSFDIQIDGRWHNIRAAEVMVINTAPWGMPKYKITDNQIDDGILEVCFIHRGKLGDIIRTFLDILFRERKTTLHCLGQGRHIMIRCQKPLSVQADGDIITETPVDIRVVPQAAMILVPE